MFKNLGKIFKPAKKSAATPGQPVEPEFSDRSLAEQWSTIELDGHQVDLFDPVGPDKPAGCVLFLHGHGRVMLRENPVFTRLFQQHQLAAVCPDGQRSWWLDVPCPEFSGDISPQQWILDRVVPAVEERWTLTPPEIALLGVSMGGQGVLQLSYRHARTFPVVAAISPAVDFHQLFGQKLPLDDMFEDVEAARQATVVLNLHPLAWPRHQWFCCDPADTDWFDGCARLKMKLASSGILFERDLETTAGGHSWDYFNHMAPAAIEHIVKGLAAS
ncbi:MAG: alpha/beta hydrolase-fold protein [Fuerstiella sp.]